MIRAPPGSSRSAVASTALAREVSKNAVMQSVDWASARILFNNYIHRLPSEVLRGISASFSSVQEAISS